MNAKNDGVIMSHVFTYKLVVVIRKDLDMRCGKIAVQVGHGVAIAMDVTPSETIKKWINEGMKKTVLKVSSFDELAIIKLKCLQHDIECITIVDYGLTQVEPNTITGLAIGIDLSEKIDKVTSELKLL